jgi:Tfp pilus assembly protein PilO
MSREDNATRSDVKVRGGAAARRQLQERLARFRSAHRTGMFGVPEVVALFAACALLAVALFAYFLLLVPQRSNLRALETEREQLQTQIQTASRSRSEKATTGETVQNILASLARFETEQLATREASSHGLVEELTEKPRRNGLARAQFSFIHQDEATPDAQQRAAANLSGSARRRQNVFPSIDISLNIEGTYANVRRFIRDVEHSRSFLVINGVQLEGVNESGGEPSDRGSLVSLRIDMSAYFRRAGAAAAAPSESEGQSR